MSTPGRHGRLYMATERMFERILSIYRYTLHWFSTIRLTLTVLFLTIALTSSPSS